MAIFYSREKKITADEFVDILRRSTLADRRPVDDAECVAGMLAHGNLLITAWDGDLLVGVSRSVTDFHFCCYLSDLAVDLEYQKHGIGKRLIDETQQCLGPRCGIILLAAPAAAEYYSRIGFDHLPRAWGLPRAKKVQ